MDKLDTKIYERIYPDWLFKGEYGRSTIILRRLRHASESVKVYVICSWYDDCEYCPFLMRGIITKFSRISWVKRRWKVIKDERSDS